MNLMLKKNKQSQQNTGKFCKIKTIIFFTKVTNIDEQWNISFVPP